jgi:glycerophosphoryl diester phosphodiesterase
MTKDGVLVAFHDQLLEESSNSVGNIYNKTWAELNDARFSYPHYGDYKLIRLDDLFQSIPHQDEYIYFFDCKNFQPNKDSIYYQTFNNALITIMDKYNLVDKSFVEFKNETMVKKLQDIRPDIKQFIYSDFNTAFEIAQQYNLAGINIAIDQITHSMVELAHSNGIMISTFNTHSHKRNIKAVEYNVDYIQTDRLKHLIKILKE